MVRSTKPREMSHAAFVRALGKLGLKLEQYRWRNGELARTGKDGKDPLMGVWVRPDLFLTPFYVGGPHYRHTLRKIVLALREGPEDSLGGMDGSGASLGEVRTRSG